MDRIFHGNLCLSCKYCKLFDMSDEEFAEIIRVMIRHEDALINQRMTWMWTLQGFMLGSIGLLWDESHEMVYLLWIDLGQSFHHDDTNTRLRQHCHFSRREFLVECKQWRAHRV